MRLRAIVLYAFMLLLLGCEGVPDDSKNNPREPNKNLDSANGNDEPAHNDVMDGKTYLLIGVDSRGEPDSRSDAIVLARYDKNNKKIKLASIMRDSYVEIPGYKNGSNKINTAYYLGGSELLRKTIYNNFDIKVDHVATVDFKGFIQLVDLLAPEGIKVNIKPEMIEDMSIEASRGDNVLHGEEILKFVRFRHDSESDFGRIKRQQEVLVQLKDNVAERLSSVKGIVTIPHLINKSMALIDTDMGMKAFLELGSSMLFYPIEDVSTLRIPVEGSFSDRTFPHSGAVLQLNKEQNQKALKDFFTK